MARSNDVRQRQCGLFQPAPSNLTPAGDLLARITSFSNVAYDIIFILRLSSTPVNLPAGDMGVYS